MKDLQFPVGISNFEKIREGGYYYIDKTNLISELLSGGIAEVTLITRPRRFGKTINMSMMAEFFRKIPWYEHSRKFSGHPQRQQADV